MKAGTESPLCGLLPSLRHALAARFTLGEIAVLAVVAAEACRRGDAAWPWATSRPSRACARPW